MREHPNVGHTYPQVYIPRIIALWHGNDVPCRCPKCCVCASIVCVSRSSHTQKLYLIWTKPHSISTMFMVDFGSAGAGRRSGSAWTCCFHIRCVGILVLTTALVNFARGSTILGGSSHDHIRCERLWQKILGSRSFFLFALCFSTAFEPLGRTFLHSTQHWTFVCQMGAKYLTIRWRLLRIAKARRLKAFGVSLTGVIHSLEAVALC